METTIAAVILAVWVMVIVYLTQPLAARFKHEEASYIVSCAVALITGLLLMGAWWALMEVAA